MLGFNEKELEILEQLDNPRKIQDFLNSLKINFEEEGDTCMSPRMVLRERKCHCIEGAMLACTAFIIHGRKPLVVDLTASKDDFDHVIAVFQENGKWGAISKTNHAVLRYREPVYSSIRELVMSYFHEYFDNNGKKTLRSFSEAIDLSALGENWITSEEDVWEVPEYLVKVKHHKIVEPYEVRKLRKADDLEIEAGKLVEWKSKS